MDRQILTRSTPDIATSGRTLEGIAFYFDKASLVSDDGVTSYLESFTPGSVTKTLKERGSIPVPLGFQHPWTSDAPEAPSIGDVRFEAAAEGLLFRAALNGSEAADRALELVNAGEHNGASVSFVPYKSDKLNGIVVRQEISIFELSLVKKGAHQGAKVLAVRSAPDALMAKIALDLRYLSL